MFGIYCNNNTIVIEMSYTIVIEMTYSLRERRESEIKSFPIIEIKIFLSQNLII